MKRDLADDFRNVTVAPRWRWLLGFEWNGQHYHENCLPFGLRTAPFLFNLFAEAFHWLLESWLQVVVRHYLDDFIFVIDKATATPRFIKQLRNDFSMIAPACGACGVPRRDEKDVEGTTVVNLGVEFDTIKMEARLDVVKMAGAQSLTEQLLHQEYVSLHEIESLA